MTQKISGTPTITTQPLAENLTQDEFNIIFVDNSYLNDAFIKQLPDLVKMAVNTAVGVVSLNGFPLSFISPLAGSIFCLVLCSLAAFTSLMSGIMYLVKNISVFQDQKNEE